MTCDDPIYNAADDKLTAAGFVFYWFVPESDRTGEAEFGRYYVRENPVTTSKFWLNPKTVGMLPV